MKNPPQLPVKTGTLRSPEEGDARLRRRQIKVIREKAACVGKVSHRPEGTGGQKYKETQLL